MPLPSAEGKGDLRLLSTLAVMNGILLDQTVMIAVCIYCLYSGTS